MLSIALCAAYVAAPIGEDALPVAAYIETESLAVGAEIEITIDLDLGLYTASKAGIPAPFLQLDVPDCVKLSGRHLTTYRELAKNEFIAEPYERLLKELPATVAFTLTEEPAEDATIGLNFTAYLSPAAPTGERPFFVRRRLELPLKGGAEARVVDPTTSDWGTDETLLQIGDEAPAFALPRADGSTFDLASVLGEKNVIVTTYRAFW